MFDEIKKKITLLLSSKDEGASDGLDKVDRRVSNLENKLKTLGKISGVGLFRNLSDLAEGTDSALGTIGRVGTALAVVEGASRSMKAIGDMLKEVADGNDGFSASLDKMGSKIPILGSFKDGFESLTEGLAKATAAAVGFDTVTAGRRGKLAGKAATIVGIPAALSGAADEISGTADAKEESKALDARTAKIRAMIDANKRDVDESNRIQRAGLSDRQKIESDRDDALEKIMDRRREWAARNAGLSKEAEERFAADELQVKRDAYQKIIKLEQDRRDAEVKALNDRLKIQRDYSDKLRDEQLSTLDLYKTSARSSAGLIGDLVEGPRGEIERLKRRTKEAIEDIKSQIEAARNDRNLTAQGRSDRIAALRNAMIAEQLKSDISERSINAKAVRDIEMRMNANNADLFAVKEEQRERERQQRITALNTQLGERAGTLDGRGITGYLAQRRQVDEFSKRTADNTKITADEVKKLNQTLSNSIFTSLANPISL